MAITIKERLESKLREAFSPRKLEVIDESHRHAGHAGAREGGETHFRVKIASSRFEGLSRVAIHRLVYEAVNQEMQERVHALAIEVVA